MNSIVSHKNFIETDALFWGNATLKDVLNDDERDLLCDLEFYDWLSSLYWGEGIAMEYALKMSEVSDNKEKWLEVYRDEHRHQTILGGWFIERGLTPPPKNKLINFLFRQVDKISSDMSEQKLVDTMYNTQIFFEELFHALIKIRTNKLKDRSLRAIFYQIFLDEADHLGKARTEISEMNLKPKKLYVILEENKSRLFPLDIAKAHLSDIKMNEAKKVQEMIVIEMIEQARAGHSMYRPVNILQQFHKIPGYNCVACSPTRHDGLLLEPKLDKSSKVVFDNYIFPKRCEGFNNIVHGGYIAMVLDEMIGYSSILSLNLLPLTKTINVTYRAPVVIGLEYRLESVIVKQEGQVITAKAFIKDLNGKVCAECEGDLFVPTKVQAPKILGKLSTHETVREMFLEC